MIDKLDKFKNDLEDISKMEIPIIADKNGMIDRQCPKEECKSLFKVHKDDWLNILRDEEVFCPFCRNNSLAKEYLPAEQSNQIVGDLKKSIRELWDYGYSKTGQNISINPREEFELSLECKHCNCRYSVVGSAYFCPSCGFNNVEENAIKAVEKTISKANKILLIQKALENRLDKDEATIITKSLIEKSISEIISTLQSFSESKYNSLADKKAPFNVFQNVEKSNKMWVALVGEGYRDWITENELRQLKCYTQKRHILEHKSGIVDYKYIEKTGDTKYQEGERIVIKSKDTIILGNITLKLLTAISKIKKGSI